MTSPEAQQVIERFLTAHPEKRTLLALPDVGRSIPIHFDRQGEPISFAEWALLTESGRYSDEDDDYRRVAFTEVGPYHVSTVWLGIDHGFGLPLPGVPYRPIIFESMVFASELSFSPERQTDFGPLGGFAYHESFDQWRYSTEDEALAGHEQLVEQVRLTWEATRHIDPRLLPPKEDT